MLYKILLGLFILAVSAALIFGPKALRVYNFIHLFDEDKIAYNFININKIFPTIPIIKSSSPHVFKKQDFVVIPNNNIAPEYAYSAELGFSKTLQREYHSNGTNIYKVKFPYNRSYWILHGLG